MQKRETATMLSFAYCGLGQIYKGHIAKGANFVIIYALLIVSLFLSYPFPALRFLLFATTLVMWLMGIADAYLDGSAFVWKVGQRKLLTTLSFAIAFGAVVVILVSQMQILPAMSKQLASEEQNTTALPRIEYSAQMDETEVSQHKSDVAISHSLNPTFAAEEVIGSLGDVGIDKADIAITTYSLKPAVVEPGTTLTVDYMISVPKAIVVGLGCSIQKAGDTEWISDSSNDKTVNVAVGGGSYSRKFVLPPTLKPGKYDVVWGVWSADFTIPYNGILANKALTVF